jgi:SAM-dependent methyltransferase
VLVDFDRSILDARDVIASAASSPLARRPPSRFHRLIEPGNPVAERNTDVMVELLPESPTVLIVGGGSIGKGIRRLYEDPQVKIAAFDIYASDVTHVVADAHQIPFQDAAFDAVVVQAVLEHVLEPAQVVVEIWRVLRSGGIVYAETPFLQHVHEGAYDFQRFTESGHRWLFRRFEQIDSGLVAGPGYSLVWTLDHLARGLFRSRRIGLRVRHLCMPLRLLDRMIPDAFAVDAASAVFFLGRKSDRELTPAEIVEHYRGAQTS